MAGYQKEIKFDGINQNVDVSATFNGSSFVINGYIDENGMLNKRFGLKSFSTSGVTLNTSIVGMYYWSSKNVVMVVSGGRLYKMSSAGVISDCGSGLNASDRASIITARKNNKEVIIVANGGSMYLYDDDVGTIAPITDANAPTSVIMLEYLDNYVIALPSNSDKIYWSDVGDPESWTATNFLQSEAKADNINAIKAVGKYLYVFGEETVELVYNAVNTFAPLDGGVVNNGCTAPYSIQSIGDVLYFQDSNRNIVKMSGTSQEIVSFPINKLLQTINNTNAYGWQLNAFGKTFYGIHFPLADRSNYDSSSQTGLTMVYDYTLNKWYEWSKYNVATSDNGMLELSTTVYAVSQNKWFVGRFDTSGIICVFDNETYKDNSEILRVEFISGFSNDGELKNKRVKKLRMRLKKGSTIELNYRNNGENQWKTERNRSITSSSSVENSLYLSTTKLGMYRSRQYKLSSSTDAPFVCGQIIEEGELLDN